MCGCFLSAFLVILTFPNFWDHSLYPWGFFLAWIAVIPFFWALNNANSIFEGGLYGFLFGVVQFLGILYWILVIKELHPFQTTAWILLALILSFYFVFWSGLYSFLKIRKKHPLLWAPFGWVAIEYLRTQVPKLGFPWGQIGYSQASIPSLLHLTTYTGIYGITFIIIGFNAILFNDLQTFWRKQKESLSLLSKLNFFKNSLVGLIGIGMIYLWGRTAIQQTSTVRVGKVAVLQPDINQYAKDTPSFEAHILKDLQQLTNRAKRKNPQLIVWPESILPEYLLWNKVELNQVVSLIRNSKIPTLVGCLDARRQGMHFLSFNSAIGFTGQGRVQGVYHKIHLVPYGEYIPFKHFLSFLGPVVTHFGSFDSGNHFSVFKARGFTYTPIICFESAFPALTRQAVLQGAQAIVNISDDSWYGKTAAAYQNALIAVVRSAEDGKPLLRAANSGICMVTNPFGKILVWSPLWKFGFWTAPVIIEHQPTYYLKHGDQFAWSCCFVAIGGIISALW